MDVSGCLTLANGNTYVLTPGTTSFTAVRVNNHTSYWLSPAVQGTLYHLLNTPVFKNARALLIISPTSEIFTPVEGQLMYLCDEIGFVVSIMSVRYTSVENQMVILLEVGGIGGQCRPFQTFMRTTFDGHKFITIVDVKVEPGEKSVAVNVLGDLRTLSTSRLLFLGAQGGILATTKGVLDGRIHFTGRVNTSIHVPAGTVVVAKPCEQGLLAV